MTAISDARAVAAGRMLVYLLVAFALRGPLFGNPVIHVDEQFYLLVGDRLVGGAVPYVDIWDRKPVGLFLLYGGIRLLGGNGIVAYQVMATIAVAATALIAARIADRLRGQDRGWSGGAAGLFYIVWLMIFDGAGGQAPVFYDLAVAGAAAIVVDALVRPRPDRLGRRGAAAMMLVGIAIQLKYTVVVEGGVLGMTLLACLRRDGAGWTRIAIHAAGWIAAALLPTIAAYAWYVAIGQGDAFVFANFVSIFARGDDGSGGARLLQFVGGVAGLVPLAVPAIIGVRHLLAQDSARRAGGLFLLAWLVAASVAILAVGTFRLQYFLPLLLPLGIAAAIGAGSLRRPRRAGSVAATVLAIGLVAGIVIVRDHVARRGTAGQVATLVDRIGQRPPGCLFVFGSEPILYHLTQSCLPSKYLFRSHLAQRREAGAIGVDPVAEVRRILANRPGVIVMRSSKGNADPRIEAMLADALRRDYDLVSRVTVGSLPHAVYRRKRRSPARAAVSGAFPSRGSANPSSSPVAATPGSG